MLDLSIIDRIKFPNSPKDIPDRVFVAEMLSLEYSLSEKALTRVAENINWYATAILLHLYENPNEVIHLCADFTIGCAMTLNGRDHISFLDGAVAREIMTSLNVGEWGRASRQIGGAIHITAGTGWEMNLRMAKIIDAATGADIL